MGTDSQASTQVTNTHDEYNLHNDNRVNLSDDQTLNHAVSNDIVRRGNTINGNVDNLTGLSNSASGYQVFKLVNLRSLQPG